MTTLRTLVGGYFLCLPSWDSLFPPRLVGPLSSVLARSTLRNSSRTDHTSGTMSWRRRRFFREPWMSRSGTRLKRSRSEIKR